MAQKFTEGSGLNCSLSVEWLNQQKSILKKAKCKNATLELIRNEFRDLFLKITGDGIKLKLLIHNLTVHKKFLSEGKATINFNETKTVVYISNAPPSNLLLFLKMLFVKMTSRKSSPKVPLREKILSNKPNTLEEISPINLKDLTRVKNEASIKPDNSKKRLIQENHLKSQVSLAELNIFHVIIFIIFCHSFPVRSGHL